MTENATVNNEDVQIDVQKKPFCRIELRVKTGPQLVKSAQKAAIKSVSKEVVLPGFRKGKAPEMVVMKKFPTQIEKESHKTLGELAFAAAQKKNPIPVLNQRSSVTFDLKHLSTEGADILFSFETEPTVPRIDPTQFEAKPVKVAEVGEVQVEEAIRQMRFFYAVWKQIQDRPIQIGDYIMINLDTIEGDHPQNVFHHVRFDVNKERMSEWMQQLVIGAKNGDILEGISRPDANATEEEKREFQPKKVRVTILKVEEAVLPEVDAEFAKKVGAKDVEHMRHSIHNLLQAQAEAGAKKELRTQVNAFLLQQYPFELPQSLLAAEKKHRLDQLAQDPEFQKTWGAKSREEKRVLEEKVLQEAEESVRLYYLSLEFVKQENIPVTHQEIQEEAIATFQSKGGTGSEIPKAMYSMALSKVILSKTQDAILEKSKKT